MQLVSRESWGARPPKGSSSPLAASAGTAYHYEGVDTGAYDHAACAGKVQGIQRFHMDTRGWRDIAYSALVCQHGYVFEGRWLNVRTAANGTDAGNSGYYAVCFLGGPHDPLTDAAKAAFRDVTQHLRDHGGAGPGVVPHSALRATACPGDTIRAWITAGTPLPARPRTSLPVWYRRVMRLLSPRQRGADVRIWQKGLIALGHLPKGSDDGVFGPDTAAATKEWQGRIGRRQTGVVGSAEAKAMAAAIEKLRAK